MKNAIKYGLVIGVLSGIWLLIMHSMGVFEQEFPKSDKSSWLEYVSVVIPFVGLYLGIKNYRDNIDPDGKMEFFEGVLEGFKIIIVGGIVTAFFAVIYMQYVNTTLTTDYMGRIGAAGLIGILFDLAISLMLMNKQKNL